VLVLTTFDADEDVLRALRPGAGGSLLKDTRRLRSCVPSSWWPRDQARVSLEGLSEREREVALATGEGKGNAEIAGQLYMSVPTVKAHVTRLPAKLGVDNRVQIALLVHDSRSRPGA
jgi:DNA-binding NarL/FixJ family response regulator